MVCREFMAITTYRRGKSVQTTGTSSLGVGQIERALDVSFVVDALIHNLAQVAFDQRRRFRPG